MICIQFYSNGGFHASDSVPGPWITFLYPVRVTLRYYFTFYMTMNVVQLPNKVTSFMISIIHSFIHSFIRSFIHSFIHWLQPSYGDSWPCWLPKMNCVVDISNWLFSPNQMTCYDVQSCLAFSEEHRWHSCFLRGDCLGTSTWVVNNATLKLSSPRHECVGIQIKQFTPMALSYVGTW